MDKNIMKLLSILTLLFITGGLSIWGKISNIDNNLSRYCFISVENKELSTSSGSLQYIFE